MEIQDETLSDEPSDIQSRLRVLESLAIPHAAVTRFLKTKNIPVPDRDEDFLLKTAGKLSEDALEELRVQYKYAGRQTINYYVFVDIHKQEFQDLIESFTDHFPDREDVDGILREPFIAETEVIGSKLYIAFGFFKSSGGRDPTTGRRKPDTTTGRCVAVIDKDMDLVEIRASDTRMADQLKGEMGSAIGEYRGSSLYQPDFDLEFEQEFNRLVEKYYNLKVRVEEEEGSTVDTISFTSKEDEAGNRRDARSDKRVAKELDERGGEITMGYVELEEGFKFQINRKQSKLSFRASYQESKLNQVTEVINDVLEKTGGYSQRTFDRFENVSE